MNEREKGLQKINGKDLLPFGFDQLSKEEQKEITKKIIEDDIELIKEAKQKHIKSQSAEHDLAVVAETVDRFDHERKYYTVKQKLETGSGRIDLSIKGGDTKFIVPILTIIGIIILGVMVIFFLR